ncbi:DUF4148 domain-containing protein [Paraburkholderia sp. D15]|uniref:DUF4148 domain-containing protein n=1 Tax=Paraburkholderia sp. D15 TaxID=2880218 RepID=UPI002479C04E|nr:DUF4148 domain-containing protein [Paraburkholderia sp. D15]WGS53184.1 DUF4148 domain-containing protein [Paraburkholderia sp. D15]
MNPSNRHSALPLLARLLTASALTVASAQLVHAQQPAAPSDNNGATSTTTQSTTTRAAKKAELKQLEKNGYQPSADDPHYPQDIQNAEKKTTGGAANGQNTQ